MAEVGRFVAPEVIRRVAGSEISNLSTAIREIRAYQVGPTEALERDARAMVKHREAVGDFSERMKFGSATGYHAEAVIDWLIAQGWTPPDDTFLPATVNGEGDGR